MLNRLLGFYVVGYLLTLRCIAIVTMMTYVLHVSKIEQKRVKKGLIILSIFIYSILAASIWFIKPRENIGVWFLSVKEICRLTFAAKETKKNKAWFLA